MTNIESKVKTADNSEANVCLIIPTNYVLLTSSFPILIVNFVIEFSFLGLTLR